VILFLIGIAFATAFVLRFITGKSWVSFATVVSGFGALG
jgi:hypothetical protein